MVEVEFNYNNFNEEITFQEMINSEDKKRKK